LHAESKSLAGLISVNPPFSRAAKFILFLINEAFIVKYNSSKSTEQIKIK
jgi:hypothetical protein